MLFMMNGLLEEVNVITLKKETVESYNARKETLDLRFSFFAKLQKQMALLASRDIKLKKHIDSMYSADIKELEQQINLKKRKRSELLPNTYTIIELKKHIDSMICTDIKELEKQLKVKIETKENTHYYVNDYIDD